MLWIIVAMLVVLWALGLIAHIGGAFVHLLLLVALISIVVDLVGRRRRTR